MLYLSYLQRSKLVNGAARDALREAARAAFEHALATDPSYPPAAFDYGNLLHDMVSTTI